MAPTGRQPRRIAALDLVVNPAGTVESEAQRCLLAYWQGLGQLDDALPARQDFDPVDLRAWLRDLMLVDVTPAPRRFRWRLLGTGITDLLGRDNTGAWFDEIYQSETLKGFADAYSICADTRAPVTFRGTLTFVDKDFISFKSMHLPFADDGHDVDLIMVLFETA